VTITMQQTAVNVYHIALFGAHVCNHFMTSYSNSPGYTKGMSGNPSGPLNC
jgi:hypothetical protein